MVANVSVQLFSCYVFLGKLGKSIMAVTAPTAIVIQLFKKSKWKSSSFPN